MRAAKGGTNTKAKSMVRRNVEVGSVVVTDEVRAYRSLDGGYSHFTVNHSAKEYVSDYVFIPTASKALGRS